MKVDFVWHDKKAKSNLTKHGVSFEEAKSVFLDEFGRFEHDPDSSLEENRFLLLGLSVQLRLLIVVHVEISEDEIRIISARRATRKESNQYRKFKQ